MFKQYSMTALMAAILLLVGCSRNADITPIPTETFVSRPTATPAPTSKPPEEPGILISEVLTGMDGNNNHDFIELYNPGGEAPFDLKGWSLWFMLSDTGDEKLVYRWLKSTLVPPRGHYLLVYRDQDVGIRADAFMDTPMIPQRGALQLRQPDDTVGDSLSWGSGAANFAEGAPAAGLKTGLALERGPGGSKGNWADTNDNAVDFNFSSPNPQNVGSLPVPESQGSLLLTLTAPDSVLPGSQFTYQLLAENGTGQTVNDLTVQFPVPEDVDIVQVSSGMTVLDQAVFWGLKDVFQVVLWEIGSLEAAGSASASIKVSTPWTYTDVLAANYSAQAADWAIPAFGSPVLTAVEGGAIPIGELGNLVGESLMIEGTATMYTGGYFAGSGNVKFYLEDKTGGVQVWVPGGEGLVDIEIGDPVRVSGELEIYRGALELVVNDPADVQVYEGAAENSERLPATASIRDAASKPELAGKLVQLEGMVVRNEEFTYSYEIDLMDESGQLITLYVDKLTNINVEAIESGQRYRATGILEIYDTRQQLYPCIQEDFERIYPPVLSLEMSAPITVAAGENVEITLTAVNFTPDTLTGLVITATMPTGNAQFVAASDGANIKGSNFIWEIPTLAGEGASVSVDYTVRAAAGEAYLTFKGGEAAANEWSEPAVSSPYYVFVGDRVPIWAIQGAGSRSPYTLMRVTTSGTATGIFPELGGFWIQERDTDNDPLTSSGIFVHTGDLDVQVAPANIVQVSGTVRETNQQTQVQTTGPNDILILDTDSSLPAPVELDPPPDQDESDAYYESLEGMVVQVGETAVVVAPTSQYGETVLVLSRHGLDRLWQGDAAQNGLGIMVDDGSSMVHKDRTTLPYALNTGDRVSSLIGPLAYTFGRYKIEPITQPQLDLTMIELPELAQTTPDAFSIITWNVENLFDILDPHPADPDKPSIREYKVSIAKVANTVVAAGAPTIVGLQEIENIEILEDIAEHEVLGGFDYQPFLIEGTDSRYIDNGFLVRGDVAEVIAARQHAAPEGLTSRPPLEIEVEIETESGLARLFVINNHFTSMSGGESATEPRRAAQAAWNVTIVENILSENPEAYVAVIGDLNSFYQSPPLDTLREAELIHIFEIDPETRWYSYIYQGASQTLDHILVTSSLYDLIQSVDVLHVNADYALPEPDDQSPLRKSDHDPVIATFSFPRE
jgi:predicted extracellular nuclease